MAEKTVTLQPGESKVVSFEATPHEAKAYQVSVDGLSGSFKATAPPEPEFVISNVSISPSSGLLGEEAILSFKITNTGGVRGDWSVTLRFSVVGGEINWRPFSVNGTLDPGQSEIRDVPLVFRREAGTWTIRVNSHVVTYIAT